MSCKTTDTFCAPSTHCSYIRKMCTYKSMSNMFVDFQCQHLLLCDKNGYSCLAHICTYIPPQKQTTTTLMFSNTELLLEHHNNTANCATCTNYTSLTQTCWINASKHSDQPAKTQNTNVIRRGLGPRQITPDHARSRQITPDLGVRSWPKINKLG